MTFAAATIASNSRLALARVTARSFLRHHAGIPFFTLLADEPHAGFRPELEPFLTLSFDKLQVDASDAVRFRYSEVELSYAATPLLIGHLLSEGFEAVLFLKQETLVLASLDSLFEELRRRPLMLTPHLIDPPQGGDALTREINVLRAGVFNGGVVGFSRSDEARRVLDWWQNKTLENCFLDVENGLHYEQRWLDFFPSLAPNCRILRDPGVNVGHWNLAERRIECSGGAFTACGVPCRVFRFSGYQPDRPEMVTRYQRHMRVEDTGDARHVFVLYQRMLEEAGWRQTSRLPYAWDFFDNGRRITPAIRSLYCGLGEGARRFGNPFATAGKDSFHAWLCRTHRRLTRTSDDG